MRSVTDRLASLSPAKQALLLRALKAGRAATDGKDFIAVRPPDMSRVPLSFSQQRLWFLDQLDGPSATYNMPIAVRLGGGLNHKALTATLQTIVDRHEALRTTIGTDQGEPFQQVQDSSVIELPVIDFSDLEAEQRQTALESEMNHQARLVFDLATGPLMRAKLIRLGHSEHVLLLTIHHIISDGWSIGKVLLEEVIECYSAFDQNRKPVLPELRIQFGDFAHWQRTQLVDQMLEQHLPYWTTQLKDLPALLDLPTDRARPQTQTNRGDVYPFLIESESLNAIKTFGSQRKATLFMTLLAAFSALLSRYANQQDIAVGSPMAGRTLRELEPLIGFFVNTLVLRSHVHPQITVDDFIKQVRQTCLGAFEHQALPFERLVEALKPDRNQSFSPLFQVMFILQNQNHDRQGLKAGGLSLESIPIDSKTAMFDMTLKLEEQGDALLGEIEYNTDLFDESTIKRFAMQFKHLLNEMVGNPDAELVQLPLMPADQSCALINTLRHEQWDSPAFTLLDLFEQRVAQQPSKVAVTSGALMLSYEDLHAKSDALAHALAQHFGAKEQLIGLCLSRSCDLIVAMLAVLKSGHAYVPIDPDYPQDRQLMMIEQAHLPLILTDKVSSANLPKLKTECWPQESWPTTVVQPWQRPKPHSEQLAYVIFTSGSTGRPKGVQISHGALINFLLAMQLSPGLNESDVLSAVTTISFDIAGLEIYLPLVVGATVDLVSRSVANDGFLLLDHLKARGSTVMQATPATWRMLFATGTTALPLSRGLCGGEALDAALASQMAKANLDVWNLYGPTETTIWSASAHLKAETGAATNRRAPSLGHAIRATGLYVLNQWLEPAGLGIPGELYIAGHGLSRGYFEQPGLTAERFLPDPFSTFPGGRMYRTGDVVIQREDARLDYVGRSDFQVKIRGFRIELGEIESVLQTHDAVHHAVAVARAKTEHDAQLVAYVQTTENWKAIVQDRSASLDVKDKWQTVWNQTYETSDQTEDDFSGWLSSYTGDLIGHDPMTAWTDESVRKILALKPKRVLEIGCGTGLLARRLAATVKHYVGVDFSGTVVQGTRDRLERAGLTNVTLLTSSADQVSVKDVGTVDTIVINSVAQYFPSADYLLDVLKKLVPCLSENGAIFLGDLRSLAHLKLQQASVHHFQSDAALEPTDLRHRIEQSVETEQELLIDAHWFLTQPQSVLTRPVWPTISLKDGQFETEMSKFRYDITLHLDRCPDPLQKQTELAKITAPQSEGTDIQKTFDRLALAHPNGFVVHGLGNARLKKDVQLVDQLWDRQQTTVPALTIEPDLLQTWAKRRGWSAPTAWDLTDPERCFSAALMPYSDVTLVNLQALAKPSPSDVPAALTNEPMRGDLARELTQQLRVELESQLPAYMVPTKIITLDRLPLTPNGKIDRAALPDPTDTVDIHDYVAPRSDLEETLCGLWSSILGIPKVGVHQNFFHLGGHSLLAVQVIAKIRDVLGTSLPIQTLFDAPTIEALARRIESSSKHHDDAITTLTEQSRARGPLSHAQRQLWFIEQLQGASAAYHVSAAAHIRGPLNIDALRTSFLQIVTRHEALRTGFIEQDGEPVAIVTSQPDLVFDVVTIANESVAKEHSVAQVITESITETITEPFDLETPSLLRVKVLVLNPSHHVLIMVIHHIVSDEWSIGVMQQELAALYPACCRLEPSPLAALQTQYGDYAAWQQQQLLVHTVQPSLGYWRERLVGAPPLLALPTDRVRPAVARQVGATIEHTIPGHLIARLKTLASEHGVTLFATLFAGWASLLGRRACTQDLVIGVPMTDRSRSELEPLVGLFVNTLPVRLDLSGLPDTHTLLNRIGRRVVEAFEHQSTPLDKIIDAVKPERTLAHTPLFQVVFVMQNAPKAKLSFSDLELQTIPTDAQVSKFDLTLSVEESGEGLAAMVEYNTDLFESGTIKSMIKELEALWQAMVDKPHWPVDALALQNDVQTQWLLSQPNPNNGFRDHEPDIVARFETQARISPQSPALAVGDAKLDYATLQQQVHHLAKQLLTMGVGPETVVGIHAAPSFEMVVALLAVLRTGAAYLPIVPQTPSARLLKQVELGQVRLVLDATDTPGQDIGTGCCVLSVQAMLDADVDASVIDWPCTLQDHLACLIFTSGSTGEPKGVQVSRRNLNAAVAARLNYYREPFTGLMLLQPFNFDVATGNILWTLCAGGCLHLEPKQTAFEPQALLERLVQTQASHLVLLPLLYGPLLSLASPSDLANLRCVIVGGEQMPASLSTQHSAVATHASLYNEYGPTETTVMCATYRLVDALATGLPSHYRAQQNERTPIGKALGQSRLYVLNALMAPVPIGVTGELYIGGPQVSRGYASRAGFTADRYLPDPFSDEAGSRLYRSGDAAKIRADGNIEIIGRTDQQIKIRGFRIEPGEIESLLTQIAGVRQAAVVAVDRGQSKTLVAYVVTDSSQAIASAKLHDAIAAHLPEYMIPAYFVALDRLPRTANGKLDVSALPPPTKTEPNPTAHTLSPVETALTKVWTDVLGVESVAPNDNFFAIGGDSILSIQAVSRGRQAGLSFTVKDLFESQTIAALARVTREHQATPGRVFVSTRSQPGPIQQWFLSQHAKAPNHFNQSVMLLVDPRCSEASLKAAISAVVMRHEMLRARFDRINGQWSIDWSQTVGRDTLHYEFIDLSDQTSSARETVLLAHANRLQSSLDIANGPLWRMARFHYGHQQPDRLLWVIHHLAVDGVSWRILFDDLESAVTQHQETQQIRLTQTATDVASWLAYIQEYATGTELLNERHVWQEQTETPVDVLPFDLDSARLQDNTQASIQSLTVPVPVAVSQAIIKDLPPRLNAHINDILLSALYRVITQWSGLSSVGVTLEGHGRQQLSVDLDLSETVGWFTSTYPIRLQAQAHDTVLQQIRSTKSILQKIPNQGIGFGLLRYLGGDDELRHKLAQAEHQAISFNYLGQFRSDQSASFILGQAKEPVGQEHKLKGQRPHVIDINGLYSDDQLHFTWTYSSALHQRTTIEKLAAAFTHTLETIVLESAATEDDNPYTPGDFPLAQFTAQDINQLYKIAGHRAKRAYPLSPTQQGMLFHSDLAGDTGAYVMQLSCEIVSPFDALTFRRAWQAVVDRHDSLRMLVMPRDQADPIQVVLRELDLAWTALDWRHKTKRQVESDWCNLLAQDRVTGFDAYRGPLMRCTLAQVEDGRWHFLWSHHHLLTDGWCLGIILKELLDIYQGKISGTHPVLDTPIPYEHYIAWLQDRDVNQAKSYWRGKLKALTSPRVLGIDRQANGTAHLGTNADEFQTLSLMLGDVQTAHLSQELGARGLTLSLAVQAAWAVLLTRYSEKYEVVFGVTTAGRPPELSGVEKIVGLFITTLPVYTKVEPGLSVFDFLLQLRDDQLEREPHAHLSLVDIKRASALKARDALFDSIVVFENYPVDQALETQTATLDIQNIQFAEQTNYPLTLTVQPGTTTTLQLAWSSARFEHNAIEQLLENLHHLLQRLPDHLDQCVEHWRDESLDPRALAWQKARLHTETARQAIDAPVNKAFLYIVDAHGLLVPEGMPGELLISGAGATERAVTKCFNTGTDEPLFHTGDRVWLDPTGHLHHLGRLDDQSKPDEPVSQASKSIDNAVHTAPSTPTERLITGLFKDVLAIDVVEVGDDFFDLGGHSLLAGRLASRLASQTGVQIPISALFEYSQVANLARYVDNLTWAAASTQGQSSLSDIDANDLNDEDDEDIEEFRL